MSKTITIDPVSRIEGHLRIDLEVNAGVVTNAWSTGTMWRGMEAIVKGRDPREAWVFLQRICGVCTTVHAIASVRAVENSLNLEIPLNAQYIRNLLILAHALHDHIVHFYALSALDWVDVTSAVKADPAKAAAVGQSLSSWSRNSVQEMRAVKEKLAGFVAQGRWGIFTNGYWGHPAMKLPPEVNLLAVAHYLQALEYQRKALQVVAILGGKTPNIQNLAVGGVANAINLDNPATLNMSKLYQVKSLLDELIPFIQQVYLPDVCAIGAMYPEWFNYGSGVGNYLASPDLPLDGRGARCELPGGTITTQAGTLQPVAAFGSPYFRDNVTESSARSWYADSGAPLHPWKGETVPAYAPWNPSKKYSWSKAPRFAGRPMEVGPLAQVLIGLAAGNKSFQKWTATCLETAGAVAGVALKPGILYSTLGRHVARAIRCAVYADYALKHWQLLVDNIGRGDFEIFNEPSFPQGEIRGFSYHEAPRGILSHWVVIKKGKIENYQAVVPSTWNLGPRDEKGQLGPVEAALKGTPIADSEKPLEALRTVHSYDPCLACAIHTHDAKGNKTSVIETA